MLHSLTPAPAFEGRVSTHHLHSTSARPADPNHYTRYLVLLSMGSQVPMSLLKRRQENTALLSNCGLTGTSQHVSLLGLGGKGCSCCVHSADVDGVELPSPLLAEAQSFDCVNSAVYFSTAQGTAPITCVPLPPVQQRSMDWVQDGGTKTHSTYYTLLGVPPNTLFLNPVASKQA